MRTVTSVADIERLFTMSGRAGDSLLMVRAVARGAVHPGAVMFVAGRKLGNAVIRNRCKRVLREACRRAGAPWAGHDVAVTARRGAVSATPAQLDRSLEKQLRKAGVLT